jgi:HEPN domain-containing protein
MTTEEHINYWIEISDDDLKVAETLLKNGHYLYAGFMCHQVIEKILKGCYVKLKNETPPYVHDLPRLAKQADFYDLFSDEQKTFLNTLTPLNIETRYPDYKKLIAKLLTKDRTEQVFEQTKQMQQWTKETILSKK